MHPALRRSALLAVLSLALFTIALGMDWMARQPPSPQKFVNQFEKALHPLERELDAIFDNPFLLNSAVQGTIPLDTLLHYNQRPFTFLIYEGDSLLFWNNNKAIPYSQGIVYQAERISRPYEMRGSEYQMVKSFYVYNENKVSRSLTLIGLIPLEYRYPIQNDYLSNNFKLLPDNFSNYVELKEDSTEYPIQDLSGNTLAYLAPSNTYMSRPLIPWIIGLYALAGLFLTFAIDFFALWCKERWSSFAAVGAMAASFVVLRWAMLYFDVPEITSEIALFQESFTNASILSSLGDFLLDTFLLFWLAVFSYRSLKKRDWQQVSKAKRPFVTFGTYALLFGGFFLLFNVVEELVLGSDIFFDVNDISKLNYQSLLSFLGYGVLVIALFLFLAQVFLALYLWGLDWRRQLLPLLTGLITIVLWQFVRGRFEVDHLWLTGLAVITAFLFQRFVQESFVTFIWVSIWLVFFSFVSTSLFFNFNQEKDFEMRMQYAQEIAYERDLKTEQQLATLQKVISNDGFLQSYFKSPFFSLQRRQIIDRVNVRYLDNKFFGRYNYKVHTYTDKKFRYQGEEILYSHFDTLFRRSERTESPYVYFYSEPEGRYVYFCEYPVHDYEDKLVGYIILELSLQKSRNSSVYVELLAQNKEKESQFFSTYSYALYKYGQRITSRGPSFQAFLPFDWAKEERYRQFVSDGQRFIAYQNGSNTAIVGSEQRDIIHTFSLFSYLFCLFLFLMLLLVGINQILRYLPKVKALQLNFERSLRARMQVSIVLLILTSFVAIALITIVYFQYEYTDYHRERLARKIESTAQTATWQIQSSPDSVTTYPDVNGLAEIHKMDVNLYDDDGALIASSEEAIFERRLRSRQMDPVAYYAMVKEGQNKYIQDEVIDDFEYLAAYVPLRNRDNQVIAYLNLPYDLVNTNVRAQEVAEFISALLNVYVLMLLLAGAAAVTLANTISRPLAEIGERMSDLKLGQKNEAIQWDNDQDEIGRLVAEYNRMIEALEESAEQLARSQRESAWREMAKQVAHEIKNPLTPMKLLIQQLKRVSSSDPERAQQMVGRVSKSIIEQIDGLAYIASEFSNFAKMPTAHNERLNLNQVARSVYELFTEEDVEVELDLPDEECIVFADKNQLVRVLNNLVKNAIQAIPEERGGIVRVGLKCNEDQAIIRIEDNGCGIPEERGEHVFVPNFTTKSSGTGLGLAMCKNIVESVGGRIYFESEMDIGTVFFVELPLESSLSEAK